MGICTSQKDKSSSKKEKSDINKHEKVINDVNQFERKHTDNFDNRMKELQKQMNNFGFSDNINDNKENKGENKNNNNNNKINNKKKFDINENKLEEIEKKEIKKQDDMFDNFEKQLKAFDF